MVSALILLGSLGLGQSLDRAEWLLAPQYVQGLELIYKGTYSDQSLVPGVQQQRQYTLETTLFIHDAAPRHWEAALQTSLGMIMPNNADSPPSPGSVRLELVQIDGQGRVRAKQESALIIPLAGPPLLETGAFFELPVARVNLQSYWECTEEGRPLRKWEVLGVEPSGGISCLKLLGTQQSADWSKPRADSTAWQRRDLIWFSPQLGLVLRVERTIDRREPARKEPTQRLVVAYELESKLRFPGKLFDGRKEEIIKASQFQKEAEPLLKFPAQYRGQIDGLLRRLVYFQEHHPPTPYRKSLVHLQSRLEQGRKGEVPVTLVAEPEERPLLREPARIGQKIPDFVVTDLLSQKSRRFYHLLGQPILVLYYNPTTETGKEVLRFAQQLYDRHGADVMILAMAVSDDVDMIRQQHEDMGLTFSILDGRAMQRTFGVEATPRVVLLDGEAVVRCAFTGWGFHIPGEITQEVKNCLPK